MSSSFILFALGFGVLIPSSGSSRVLSDSPRTVFIDLAPAELSEEDASRQSRVPIPQPF
jgi:hypothetical protein